MAHLPLQRTKTIMKTTDGVEAISKEAIFIMTRAAELFIKQLASASVRTMGKSKELNYNNLVHVVHNTSRYEFLEYMIPKKITVRQYKKLMEQKRADEFKNELPKKQPVTEVVEIRDSSSDDESSSSHH